VRIGVDGREFARGARTGIGRYLRGVLAEAAARGHQCMVYGDGATALDPTLRATLCRLDAPSTGWWDQVRLPAALARDRVSVFLSPYYKGPLRARCPVVLTIHDLFFIGYPGASRRLHEAAVTWAARLYARRAARIVADSDYARRSVIERLRVAAAKIEVIPVAVGAEFHPGAPEEARERRWGATRPYVLYVGNFKPHKNLPRLLAAYAALPEAIRETYRLVLAGGDGAGRERLERLAGELALRDRVVFTGPVDDADLPALYRGSSLVALVSLVEGFGLPAVEAMACGVPVVASDRAALPEVLGDAAVLVDPDDVGAIATALQRVLDDGPTRAELVRRGIERARPLSRALTAGRVIRLLEAVEGGAR
jgi:glycosyltransferase involved in cell wall biosynthesis